MEIFAAKWFTFYYLVLGLAVFLAGCYCLVWPVKIKEWLVDRSTEEVPPALLRGILKYFLLFSLAGLMLSLLAFSWTELLFSLWSLLIIFLAGSRLVRWEESRKAISEHPERVEAGVRTAGAIMVAVSLVIFALGYLVIQGISV